MSDIHNPNNNISGNGVDNQFGNSDEFLEDYKEKRKLLIRWSHYFPHEPLKDFDVPIIFNHF